MLVKLSPHGAVTTRSSICLLAASEPWSSSASPTHNLSTVSLWSCAFADHDWSIVLILIVITPPYMSRYTIFINKIYNICLMKLIVKRRQEDPVWQTFDSICHHCLQITSSRQQFWFVCLLCSSVFVSVCVECCCVQAVETNFPLGSMKYRMHLNGNLIAQVLPVQSARTRLLDVSKAVHWISNQHADCCHCWSWLTTNSGVDFPGSSESNSRGRSKSRECCKYMQWFKA